MTTLNKWKKSFKSSNFLSDATIIIYALIVVVETWQSNSTLTFKDLLPIVLVKLLNVVYHLNKDNPPTSLLETIETKVNTNMKTTENEGEVN